MWNLVRKASDCCKRACRIWMPEYVTVVSCAWVDGARLPRWPDNRSLTCSATRFWRSERVSPWCFLCWISQTNEVLPVLAEVSQRGPEDLCPVARESLDRLWENGITQPVEQAESLAAAGPVLLRFSGRGYHRNAGRHAGRSQAGRAHGMQLHQCPGLAVRAIENTNRSSTDGKAGARMTGGNSDCGLPAAAKRRCGRSPNELRRQRITVERSLIPSFVGEECSQENKTSATSSTISC